MRKSITESRRTERDNFHRPRKRPHEPGASGIAVIDPVTRLEGHLKIEVEVDDGYVVDAKATGTLFRGFESILLNRHPSDAQHITQRICGVCPVSHGMAAVITLDKAYGVVSPDNARIMRNLVMAANMIDSHILHFYHLTLPDFIQGPAMPPWTPTWVPEDNPLGGATEELINNYVTALDMRREAHEAGAIFGGRLPHPPAFIPGGFTTRPTSDAISAFKRYMSDIVPFVRDVYISDVERVCDAYKEYFDIGKGYCNLLAFGAFDLDAGGTRKLFKSGLLLNGRKKELDVQRIAEEVTYSWYNGDSQNLSPSAGVTVPQYPKPDAYSWLKAPRYDGAPCEAGPLARMTVNGDYPGRRVSVMDRHLARAHETLKVAEACLGWVEGINPSAPVAVQATVPNQATAFGLTEAPRGALGHWLEISGGKISRYQIITPTCWNASPRDAGGQRGPIEEALIGTPVASIDQPIEVVRVIHSFDPCLSCAVHVMRPARGKKIFLLEHYHGGEKVHSHDDAHAGPAHAEEHEHRHAH
jgi:hydrogenase large subunit